MATFPAIAPIQPAGKNTSPLASRLLLGDGYEVESRFGLNNVRPEWSLVWEVGQSQADQIDAFLQARADAGEHFDWQPPDAATALRWRCDEWNVEQLAFNWFRVSATFRRVFELSAIELLPAASYSEFPGDQCAVGSPDPFNRVYDPVVITLRPPTTFIVNFRYESRTRTRNCSISNPDFQNFDLTQNVDSEFYNAVAIAVDGGKSITVTKDCGAGPASINMPSHAITVSLANGSTFSTAIGGSSSRTIVADPVSRFDYQGAIHETQYLTSIETGSGEVLYSAPGEPSEVAWFEAQTWY